MKIQAIVVADSKNEFGNRLTTLLVTMPRYILAEFNTRSMLSKNSAISIAIPFKKMVEAVEKNPFIPVAWMKDHKGMQGSEYLTEERDIEMAKETWLRTMDKVIQSTTFLNKSVGVTKQISSRPLEAFMWHTVLLSGTEWENFFALRCPQYHYHGTDQLFRSRKDFMKEIHWEKVEYDDILFWLRCNKSQADIHMMLTAEAIWDAMNESTPKKLNAGDWHIPFGDLIEEYKPEVYSIFNQYAFELQKENPDISYGEAIGFLKIKIATARCAQTSYTVIGEDEKEMDYEKLIKLHDRLAKSGHWSPFEHCAIAMNEKQMEVRSYFVGSYEGNYKNIMFEPDYGMLGNFKGFIQYRKLFGNENITKP